MTITLYELLLYAGAVLILFLIPGPVWAALIARTLSGGFQSAWPLAAGVVIGDAIWTVIAILGVTWVVAQYADFLIVLRFFGAALLAIMGAMVIRNAGHTIRRDARLTAPGRWAGFSAGGLIALGNPKATLFYLGVLPGFFDVTRLGVADIIAITFVSMIVPFLGNLTLAAFVSKARALISSEVGRWRINLASGIALIVVGVVIGLS